MVDVDVNDGVYANNEMQQSEHNSGISFLAFAKGVAKFGQTAAAPRPSYNVLDQGAEQNTSRCRRCGFNS